MGYQVLYSFDNYIDANLRMMQLQQEDINCWLKDEYTVTIDPILTNAIGGIKLMVHDAQLERATEILKDLLQTEHANRSCPYCGSGKVEYIVTNRKPSNWFLGIFTFLLGDLAIGAKKVYHCFDCEQEFDEAQLEKRNQASGDLA
jgi:DNA-directed RNA polymerase subunit RPC12/RpoP